MPPLRQLAPHPMVSASRTATRTPRFASPRAAESPQKPAPTPARSTCSGSGPSKPRTGSATVCNQQFVSLMDMIFLRRFYPEALATDNLGRNECNQQKARVVILRTGLFAAQRIPITAPILDL